MLTSCQALWSLTFCSSTPKPHSCSIHTHLLSSLRDVPRAGRGADSAQGEDFAHASYMLLPYVIDSVRRLL